MTHLASFIVLILRLLASKSASGISLKTQELLLMTFLFRYTDLFYIYRSLYNSTMKLLYIGFSAAIV